MDQQTTNSLIPTGIGYSYRLIIALILIAAIIISLFITFIFKYSPKSIKREEPSVTVHDDPRPSMLLQQLLQQHNTVTTTADSINNQEPLHTEVSTSPNAETQYGLSDEAFLQAGQAEISVFKKTNMPHEFNQSAPSHSSIQNEREVQESVDDYQSQNQQTNKEHFLLDYKTKYDHSLYQASHSPYELKAGSWINATLLTGINSDLPGNVVAKVNRSVFDTKTGNYPLIPQGTTLLGVYDSHISFGQSRVLLVWTRLIFPNGNSLDLQGMPGVDLLGMMGLQDKVNFHYQRIFGSALLFSAFSAAGQLSQSKNSNDQLTNQQIIYSAIGQQMTQTGNQLIEKNSNIQPTIQIRPGTRLNVLLTQDFIFPGAYNN